MPSNLKEAREKAGYSIEEVAEKLSIRKQYIICLEKGDFQGIPGKIYVDGYTKMYHELLGLDPPHKAPRPIKKKARVNLSNKKRIKRKYVIFFSTLMLILVIVSYSLLKPSQNKTPEYEIINIQEQHENNENNRQRLFTC